MIVDIGIVAKANGAFIVIGKLIDIANAHFSNGTKPLHLPMRWHFPHPRNTTFHI